MTDRPIIPVDRPYVKHDPVPQFDESRPHPYVDPLQPNGTITAFTPNAIARITVRNPIKRGAVVNWKDTAEDLAKNLYATSAALAVSRELTDLKNEGIDRRERRIATLEKQLENQRETIRQYREGIASTCDFKVNLSRWWAWRLFASRASKQSLWNN